MCVCVSLASINDDDDSIRFGKCKKGGNVSKWRGLRKVRLQDSLCFLFICNFLNRTSLSLLLLWLLLLWLLLFWMYRPLFFFSSKVVPTGSDRFWLLLLLLLKSAVSQQQQTNRQKLGIQSKRCERPSTP
jgi:hypothetical protein